MSGIAQAKTLAVVANNGVATSNIKSSELNDILNGRTRNWPNGLSITVILRDPFSPDMQPVLRWILHMTPEQMQSVIQTHPRQILVVDSDDAVIRLVSTTRGAIGIVDLYSLANNIKVVKIDDKLPFDSGYVLKGN